jgi:hypothetical protein
VGPPSFCYPLAVDTSAHPRHWPLCGRGPLGALVIVLVLIGHLGLGFSLLANAQGLGSESQVHPWIAAEAGDPDLHHDSGCDHCCHAPAHLLGLIRHHPLPPLSPLTVPRAGYGGIWYSHIPAPPTRPPRSSI